MKAYNQHCFDEDYYENFKRGGFKGYNWENLKREQERKLNWIEKCFKDIESILFVACAKGLEVKEARKRGYSAWGCDMSDYAIYHSDSDISGYIIKADARDLTGIEDERYDLVCMFDAIHIIDIASRFKAYDEINRVAKKGIVLRTRILPAQNIIPGNDNTIDGDITFRETFSSLITNVEDRNKFKMFNVKLGQRYVMWAAFGCENGFKTTHKMMLDRDKK